MPRIETPYKLAYRLPRMSWNKYNLFNSLQYTVDHKTSDNSIYTKHLYAQRQMAKRMTRKYHGQGLRERIFTKQLYTSKFNVVAGGSADKEVLLWAGFYMNVERRLDTVIFRSLFASSIEQARQLIKHGHVDVNGMKERRSNLLLKPGDIYHANPQMVKTYISDNFHKHTRFLDPVYEGEKMQIRTAFLNLRGQQLEDVLPKRPDYSHLFEYSPYEPILKQGRHPLVNLLDARARREDDSYQKRRFVPKPFMAPNVYLPAYLEVSYRSCTGAFVRLPHIKRDSLMEIPSPFKPNVHERAGLYYSTRGRYRKQGVGFRGYRKYFNRLKA